MSGSVDRILDLLDGAGQSSYEEGFGDDVLPDRCFRCRRHDPDDGSDLCAGCRSFLLEDTDDDPLRPARPEPGTVAHYIRERLEQAIDERMMGEIRGQGVYYVWVDELIDTEALSVAWSELATAIVDAVRPALELIADALNRFAPVVLDVSKMMAELDEAIASSRARAAHGPTLDLRGALAPPRDLRATEAPRRPPARNRRPRC